MRCGTLALTALLADLHGAEEAGKCNPGCRGGEEWFVGLGEPVLEIPFCCNADHFALKFLTSPAVTPCRNLFNVLRAHEGAAEQQVGRHQNCVAQRELAVRNTFFAHNAEQLCVQVREGGLVEPLQEAYTLVNHGVARHHLEGRLRLPCLQVPQLDVIRQGGHSRRHGRGTSF